MSRFATVALLAAFTLAACNKAPAPPAAPAAPVAPAAPEAPPAAAPAEVKPGAALDVEGVDLGTEVGADNRITTALETFGPHDTIVTAITVQNASAAPVNGSVGVQWKGPDGKVFNDEAQARDFAAGMQTISFRVADPKGFPSGDYTLEVSLGGSVVQTKRFSVK